MILAVMSLKQLMLLYTHFPLNNIKVYDIIHSYSNFVNVVQYEDVAHKLSSPQNYSEVSQKVWVLLVSEQSKQDSNYQG